MSLCLCTQVFALNSIKMFPYGFLFNTICTNQKKINHACNTLDFAWYCRIVITNPGRSNYVEFKKRDLTATPVEWIGYACDKRHSGITRTLNYYCEVLTMVIYCTKKQQKTAETYQTDKLPCYRRHSDNYPYQLLLTLYKYRLPILQIQVIMYSTFKILSYTNVISVKVCLYHKMQWL